MKAPYSPRPVLIGTPPSQGADIAPIFATDEAPAPPLVRIAIG
ncbi:hypothetical protein [Streptomyces sp. TP-A0874]|nr:hypothetical protein [Streptomyces sp. TP-A0874]